MFSTGKILEDMRDFPKRLYTNELMKKKKQAKNHEENKRKQ